MTKTIRKEKDIFPLRRENMTDNIEYHTTYDNKGRFHGRQKIYCNGELSTVHNYKNGNKLFTISFYKNITIASKTIFINGSYCLHKTYYPSGELYLNQTNLNQQ